MCRRQAINETRKGRLKSYADVTIYATVVYMPSKTGVNKVPPQTS